MLKKLDLRSKSLLKQSESRSYYPNPELMISHFIEPIVTANGAQEMIFSLKQKLAPWGELSDQETSLKSKSKAVAFRRRYQEEIMELKISEHYFRLGAIQEKIEILRSFREILKSFQQAAMTKYEHGNGIQHDVLKADLELVKLEKKVLELETIEEKIIEILCIIIGVEPMRLDAKLPDIDTISVNERTVTRSDLSAIKEEIKSLEYQASAFSKQALPKLSIGIQYGLINEKEGIRSNKDAIAVQFGITIPIFSGRDYLQEEAAQIEMNQLELSYKDKMNEINSKHVRIQNEMELLKKEILLLDTDLIPKSEMLFQSALTYYANGKLDFLNLISSEKDLIKMKLEKIEKHSHYLSKKAELKFERIGGGK